MIEHWPDDQEPETPVDQLLLRCVEAPDAERAVLLDGLCAQHPGLAAELRERWQLLADVGFLAGPPSAPLPERIGPFRVRRRLGSGGMGVVYLAEQDGLGRQIALKVLRPEFALSDRARERFRREGVILSRLEHPGICPVYEVGEAEGVPFLAMRWLQGRTLAELIEAARQQAVSGSVRLRKPAEGQTAHEPDERTRIQEVLAVFERVAAAVHAAHAAGLVHRDLKPANVMITPDGPVVLDFGLARDDTDAAGLTHTGDVLGTPAYLAPEQLQGGWRADARTDVYALGVSLYESLTLVRPFQGGNREALYRQTLDGAAVDVRTRNRHVGRDLAVVVATAMDRNPERRYASSEALAEDLRRVRLREPIAARPAGLALRTWRWMQRNPVLAAFVLFLLAATLLTGGLLTRVRSQLRQTQALAIANLAYQVSEREPKAGLWLACRAAEQDERVETRSQLYTALARSHEELRFLGHGVVNRVRYARDGQHLVSASDDGTARVWDLQRQDYAPIVLRHRDCVIDAWFVGPGNDRVLTASYDGTAVLWGIDGDAATEVHRFGATGSGKLMGARIAEDGSTALLLRQDRPLLVDLVALRVLHELRHEGRIEDGGLSADGTMAVTAVGYGREVPSVPECSVRIWRVADGAMLHEVARGPSLRAVCFLPDGSLLTAGLDGAARRWDTATGVEIGEPIVHGSPVWSAAAGRAAGTDWVALGGTKDCSLRLHRLSAPRGPATLVREQPGPALAFTLQPLDDGVLAAMFDGTARHFDLTGKERRVLRGHSDRIYTTAVVPGTAAAGRRAATASWDGTVRTWRLDDPLLEPVGFGGREHVHVAVSSAGTAVVAHDALLLAGPGAAPVRIPVRSALDGWTTVAPAGIAPDGRFVALATFDHRVELYEHGGQRRGGFPIDEVRRSSRAIYRVAVLDGERLLLVAVDDDRASRATVVDLQGRVSGFDQDVADVGHVFAVDVDFRRQRIALGGQHGVAVFGYDGRQQGPLLRAPMVGAVALTPDGRHVAAALRQDSACRVLRFDIWHTDATPAEVLGHLGDVYSLGYAPDGRLLTGCFDGSVRIWSADMEIWARIDLGAMGLTTACWEPDGRWIWTAHHAAGLRRWPATMPGLLDLARERSVPRSAQEAADYEARLAAGAGQ